MEIISPAVDMIIFLSVFYVLLYVLYGRIFGKDIVGIYKVDIKITALLFVLAYLVYNGSGVTEDIFGYEVGWFWVFVVISTAIESLIFLIYKRIFKINIKTIQSKR